MRYTSIEQIQQLIPSQTLVELSNDASVYDAPINFDVIENIVSMTEDKVDAYLSSRYDVPLQNTHRLVSDIVVVMVRHALYSRRPERDLPEIVKESYKNAIKELEAIRDGKILLGINTDASGEVIAESYAEFHSESRRSFGRC